MNVTLDPDAGFCFGVKNAISLAESELAKGSRLYCLDDIVHNSAELGRLKDSGLALISHEELPRYRGKKVLVRAHGEPPETFRVAIENQIEIIDATCPIVAKLQERIENCLLQESKRNIQIVIFGKKGHAEVLGLLGHSGNTGTVVSEEKDLQQLDFRRPVRLFSQTTMDIDAYEEIASKIRERMQELFNDDLVVNKSYCKQVSLRSHTLRVFAANHDVLIFVSDSKSSNGAFLFNVCRNANPRSYFVNNEADLNSEWFQGVESAGVSGATSTPVWLMQKVTAKIREFDNLSA